MDKGQVYLVDNPKYAAVLAAEAGVKGNFYCDKKGRIYQADYVATARELAIRGPESRAVRVHEFSSARDLLKIATENKDGIFLRPKEEISREISDKGWVGPARDNAIEACMVIARMALHAPR